MSQNNKSNFNNSQNIPGDNVSVSSKQNVSNTQISRRHLSQSHSQPTRHITSNQLHQSQIPSHLQSNLASQTVSNQGSEDEGQIVWGTSYNVVQVMENFREFLLNYQDDEKKQDHNQMQMEVEIQFKYRNRIVDLELNQYQLNVDCQDLFSYNRQLYKNLVYWPSEIIVLFDKVASEVFVELMPEQINVAWKVLVGFTNLNFEHQKLMKQVSHKDLNHMISVQGIVIRCSNIYPEMKQASFRCFRCKNQVSVVVELGNVEEPNDCQKCKSKFSFQIEHQNCTFTDKQYIKLQERPDQVLEGESPTSITLLAYDKNVDSIKPGDIIECIGIYRAVGMRKNQNRRALQSIYNTYIDVLTFNKVRKNKFSSNLSEDEKKQQFSQDLIEEMRRMAHSNINGTIYERLTRSIAPSIWENEDVKKGILCQLFGGSQKDFSQSGKGRFRAEINCLLVGDPSVAKSQMLQYVHKIAPRGIYTSGKGSSSVGLTAYVSRDPDTKEIVLESGALVLSDLGICCIDEFDKMDDNTRSILHEAMEQQTISVAKAGIVATLNARTAILAGANPKGSRYNPKWSVIENLDLPPSLLSRFDLIYILLDQVNEDRDKKLCQHILNMYTIPEANQSQENTNADGFSELIPREKLSQYISYARAFCTPVLSDEAVEELKKNYIEMRQMGQSRKVITSTPRQLESAIRLSEAIAKMKLSDEVSREDVEEAVRLIKVATQAAVTDPITGMIDMDQIQTGITTHSRQRQERLVEMIKDFINNNQESLNMGIQFETIFEQMKNIYQQKFGENISLEDTVQASKKVESDGLFILYGNKNKPTHIRRGNNISE